MAEWGKRFREVASPAQDRILVRQAGKASIRLIKKGFSRTRDPYGNRWERKKVKNGKRTLVDSGAMRNGWSLRPGIGRFRISNSQHYAGYHQSGVPSRNLPRRMMWPQKGRLPTNYAREYNSIFQKRMAAILKKRRPT